MTGTLPGTSRPVVDAVREDGSDLSDLVVHAPRAIVGGEERGATVVVDAGRITHVLPLTEDLRGRRTKLLARGEVLLPGLVDTHVHVNEPGRTHWEGFATATRAAAHGGVTTIVDMPLNSLPPTLTPAALEAKREAATAAGISVDVGFWGGAVPENLEQLPELLAAGVFGVKAFLVDSGVPEFPALDAAQLRRAMELVAASDGLVIVHAEDPAALAEAPAADGRSYPAFLASRPPGVEAAAVATVVEAARATGCRAHVVHLSSAEGAELVRAARAEGVRITAETCPHYLTIAAEDVPDGAPQFKCCPPVRGRTEQDALWQALVARSIEVVVSDHSPAPPDVKLLDTGDLANAWGGISSLEVGLQVVWSAARRRGIELSTVVEWMARRPADLVGLPAKGRIEVGADADLVVFAPDDTAVLRAEELHHRHPVSPYEGRTVTGVVRTTYLRGVEVTAGKLHGELLTRP